MALFWTSCITRCSERFLLRLNKDSSEFTQFRSEWGLACLRTWCCVKNDCLSLLFLESLGILKQRVPCCSYEKQGRVRRVVKAQQLWYAIIESQTETGTPYMLYKDSCNRKSNQQNLGTIKCSNLCTEIVEYTSKDEVGGEQELVAFRKAVTAPVAAF